MLIEARTQQEIASVLGVSQQTISLDVAFLEKRAKEETKVLVEKKLPLAHLNAINGIDKVIRECWKVINETKSDQIKHMYLTLVSNSYRIRDNFLTDAKTVSDVVQFIDTNLKKIADYDLQELQLQ